MDKLRPYVTAAMLCESVLQEPNGTISVIRIADRIGYDRSKAPPGFQLATRISGLFSIKSGPVTGEHMARIFVENPAGERTQVFELQLNLQGRDHGQNIIINAEFGIKHDGLHWFDLVFDDEVLTRVPLMVAQEAVAPAQKEPAI